MTLRETIDHVLSRGAQAHIHTCLYNIYYRTRTGTFPQVMHVYGNVLKELQSLPTNDNIDLHLVIDSVVDTDTCEEYVDVHLHDTIEDELCAVDFVDWGDLIDILIVDNIGLSPSDQLAHILWEITFWGFDRETVAREKKTLDDATQERVDIQDIDDLLD